mgnify:CR=1 FL=1
MAAQTDVAIKIRVYETATADLGSPNMTHLLELLQTAYASGTVASTFDTVWSDTRNLVGATEALDLAGSLTGLLGGTITFAKLCGLIIRNNATTTAFDLKVGGAAANAWYGCFDGATHIAVVPPGGFFWWFSPIDGKTVTAGTGDQLKIDSGANTISYSILLLGRSA